jgi:hypothetical protein
MTAPSRTIPNTMYTTTPIMLEAGIETPQDSSGAAQLLVVNKKFHEFDLMAAAVEATKVSHKCPAYIYASSQGPTRLTQHFVVHTKRLHGSAGDKWKQFVLSLTPSERILQAMPVTLTSGHNAYNARPFFALFVRHRNGSHTLLPLLLRSYISADMNDFT